MLSAANAASNVSNQVTGPEIVGVDPPMAIIKEHPGIVIEEEEQEEKSLSHSLNNNESFIGDLLEVKETYEYCNNDNPIKVKGKLRDNMQFWVDIGASNFVLNIIRNGYKLTFITLPCPKVFKNNKSAINNTSFVEEALLELIKSERILEVDTPQQ